MMLFPNAKVNLGLHVTSKRPDGYHNLETCFYPVPVTDVLELRRARHFSLREEGRVTGCKQQDNLCYRAWKLLQETYGIDPVEMVLIKHLPNGAGLGGGSSNAAYMLKGLNQVFELGLTSQQLQGYASQIGSDCAFFIENKPVMAVGRGNEFSPATVNLAGVWCLLVWPGFGVSTKEAYAGITPQAPANGLVTVLTNRANWQKDLRNDFEETVFALHPRLAVLKAALYEQGAFYAAMSGSGSCLFGLFDFEPDTLAIQRAGYWIVKVQLA